MIDINYKYYLDLEEFKVKLPNEVDSDSKKAANILRNNGYSGFHGSRGEAEQAIIKKEISHLKYALRDTMETDDEYLEMSARLKTIRAKIPTITEANYPEWFI
ncbi:MAG: hypothetical protein DRH57_01485 [Candidatus Cloacimonadota bacterium]|nr:MAG: hypothetical protein DRH57_01485 [Candidatus Cloacimonadota bacterium]